MLKNCRVNRDYDGSVGSTSLNFAAQETYLSPLKVIIMNVSKVKRQ